MRECTKTYMTEWMTMEKAKHQEEELLLYAGNRGVDVGDEEKREGAY